VLRAKALIISCFTVLRAKQLGRPHIQISRLITRLTQKINLIISFRRVGHKQEPSTEHFCLSH